MQGFQLGDEAFGNPGGLLIFVGAADEFPIAGAEADEGIFGQAVLLEGGHDFANAPVELYHGITAQVGAAFPLEALVGDAEHVVVVRGEEKEEGFVLVGGDELAGFLDPFVGEIFVAEAGGVASRVESDAADAGGQRVAGGCVGRGGAIAAGETLPLGGEFVDVRGLEGGVAVGGNVASG